MISSGASKRMTSDRSAKATCLMGTLHGKGAAALPRVKIQRQRWLRFFRKPAEPDGRRHKPLQGWRGPDGGARAL